METKLIRQVEPAKKQEHVIPLTPGAFFAIISVAVFFGSAIAIGAMSMSKASAKEYHNLQQAYTFTSEVAEDVFDAVFAPKKVSLLSECSECHKQAAPTPKVCNLCDADCTHWVHGEPITTWDRARARCHKPEPDLRTYVPRYARPPGRTWYGDPKDIRFCNGSRHGSCPGLYSDPSPSRPFADSFPRQ